jgi:hypothetical protein
LILTKLKKNYFKFKTADANVTVYLHEKPRDTPITFVLKELSSKALVSLYDFYLSDYQIIDDASFTVGRLSQSLIDTFQLFITNFDTFRFIANRCQLIVMKKTPNTWEWYRLVRFWKFLRTFKVTLFLPSTRTFSNYIYLFCFGLDRTKFNKVKDRILLRICFAIHFFQQGLVNHGLSLLFSSSRFACLPSSPCTRITFKLNLCALYSPTIVKVTFVKLWPNFSFSSVQHVFYAFEPESLPLAHRALTFFFLSNGNPFAVVRLLLKSLDRPSNHPRRALVWGHLRSFPRSIVTCSLFRWLARLLT